jgi:DNA-binding response OmpR family regulator
MDTCLDIVVVEDHDSLRQMTVQVLREHGHSVIGLACAEELDNTPAALLTDLYIIDLGLPGEDGVSLAQRIRQANAHVGIIMVTARNELMDKVTGYENGADIYLPKPVSLDELLAAINSLARRIKAESNGKQNTLLLELHHFQLVGPTGKTTITASDTILLSALAQAPGQRLETWQLAEMLSKDVEAFNKASLEVKIVRLRKKITQVGGSEEAIKSIRLYGYQLCVPLKLS